jgi:hypothetical protein
VISPEQLAKALDRIHPRDRELLSLSLRRRVPDEALGRVYDCPPGEVARRRARAIERLADALELQRGEDLGAVLQALLAPATWSATAATVGEEFAAGGRGPRLTAVPLPEQPESRDEPDSPEQGEPPPPPALAPVPSPAEDEVGEKERAGNPPAGEEPAEQPQTAEDGAATSTDPELIPVDAEPVLEMLAARRSEAPDPPRRAVPLALLGLGLAALVGAAGVVGATQFGDSNEIIRGGGGGDDGTRQFTPHKSGPLAAPFPSDPRAATCYSTANVTRATELYREPGASRRLKLSSSTEWGSDRVLGIVNQRGGWLAVQAPELRNGEVGWIRRADARVACVRWSLHADLSKRVLYVRRDGHTVRKFRVAIGRSENPTPKGRFSVTDKLKVTGSSSPYGCCVLALNGHQTHLPAYWPGGDRLAIHATDDGSSIGNPVSLGCMRAESRQARWLINTIPLGAPVFISA